MSEQNKYRYAEKCLYEYKRNLAGLKVLREDLRVLQAGTDVHAQSYQLTFGFSGTVSDPVHARLVTIEGIEERIRKLAADPEKYRSGIDFKPDERYPDLSREELMLHTIMAIAV